MSFAGFVSGICTFGFIWFLSYVRYKSDFMFVALASLSFGLSLVAVLWFFRRVHNWSVAVWLVASVLAAHALTEYALIALPRRLLGELDVARIQTLTSHIVVLCFAASLIMFTAFLLLVSPLCRRIWVFPIGFFCAAAAALTVGFIDGAQRGAWFSIWVGMPLLLLWQLSLAFFLGVALSLGQLTSSSRFELEGWEVAGAALSKNRFAVFTVLLAYFVVVAVWWQSARVHEATRIYNLQAQISSGIAESRAAAPSMLNLPELVSKPINEVLLMQDFSGWKPYMSGTYERPAESATSEFTAIYPRRLTYYAYYAEPGSNFYVQVQVTQYPNEAWSKYEVTNTPMPNEFIEHPERIKKWNKFGQTVYQDGPYLFWSSDDKLIFLECQMVKLGVIDAFLKQYLDEYPSSN